MPEVRVIGITGQARSGKDTVADLIRKRIGGARYSFAKPIYDMLAAVGFDFKAAEWDGLKDRQIAGLGISPRRMMQTLGTEWGRELVHPELWVRLAEIQLDYATKMIISDVRFDNEADWVREHGVLIRVVRPEVELVEDHVSEKGITPRDGDLLIENSGTLVQLEKLVNLMVDRVFEA